MLRSRRSWLTAEAAMSELDVPLPQRSISRQDTIEFVVCYGAMRETEWQHGLPPEGFFDNRIDVDERF